jgi:hypothetical protein
MKKTSGQILILFFLLIVACRSRNGEEGSGDYFSSSKTSEYEDGDILRITPLPADFREWIGFYASVDTAFAIHNFKASGVTIHFDSMPNAISKTNEAVYKPLLAYSPDSTHFIDFFSYNQFLEKDGAQWYASTGDPDQEIKLVDKSRHLDKQLMYYGPSQAVEAAAWVNNYDFILGIMSLNDSSTAWIPEIYLFNLKDSTFTNFRLGKTIKVDSLVLKDKNYFETFFKKRNIIMR